MSTAVKILIASCIALVLPLLLLKLVGGFEPALSQDQRRNLAARQLAAAHSANEEAIQAFQKEALRRTHFVNGFGRLQTARMLIGSYHHQNYELPTSFEQLGHDLSGPENDGPDGFEMDTEDSSISMYFEGQSDIEDGVVTYTPTVDENNEKIAWECWSTDYPDIENLVAVCKYYPPR